MGHTNQALYLVVEPGNLALTQYFLLDQRAESEAGVDAG